MTETFGQYLLNDALPDGVRLEGPVTKKVLSQAMAQYAKQDPAGYAASIQRVKKVGDEVSTLEGLSVGLDDIAPDYVQRDPIMRAAMVSMKAAKTDAEKRKILLETQDKILKTVQSHPSDMTLMARSGGRGSMAQLMKTVASPIVATSAGGDEVPWLINKSYSQGLSAADSWVTGAESRRNAIASTGSVVEPGAVAKVVVTNMDNLVITTPDCRTTTGILLAVGAQVTDRYLARREGDYDAGTLVTGDVLGGLKRKGVAKVLVRSPATCKADDGICQKCMGLNEWGKPYPIGSNVGVRSAQALTEPLTQFALNAKHGVRMAGGKTREPAGLTGFRTLTEVPKSFMDRASLAEADGVVTSVVAAPQGGTHIKVDSKSYYIPPGLKPLVKAGDKLEAGDALSDGVPMPDDVVRLKGVGAGRVYMADAVTSLYNRQGVDIDRRHTELLARNAMNYVQIKKDPTSTFIKGDVVNFKDVQAAFKGNSETTALDNAKGRMLGEDVLHYTVGTRITDSVLKDLRDANHKDVQAATGAPEFDPVMKSIIQTPLLSEDWMSRLGHRYLRKTLVDGAGMGYMSDLSSTSPVPAFVAGNTFGTGMNGKYASEDAEYEHALEKLATAGKLMPMVKNVMFGSKRPIQGMKHIATEGIQSGGVYNQAHLARRMGKNMGGVDFEGSGITQDGVITEAGRKVIDRVQGMRSDKGLFGTIQRGVMGGPAPQHRYNAAELDSILPGVSNHITPGKFQRWDDKNTLGWRVGKTVQDMAMGSSPLQVLKQRYQTGGLVGKGGVMTGDFALDPDTVRAYKNYRSTSVKRGPDGKLYRVRNGSFGELAGAAGGELMNKTFTLGMPAMALHSAATAPLGEGESRGGNIGAGLGDVAGWSAGSPFGMIGGGLVAAPVNAAGRWLGEKMDKNYVPPAAASTQARVNNSLKETAYNTRPGAVVSRVPPQYYRQHEDPYNQ